MLGFKTIQVKWIFEFDESLKLFSSTIQFAAIPYTESFAIGTTGVM